MEKNYKLIKLKNMEKKFVVDYDNKVLTLYYQDQIFMFDLNMGDVGDFWHGFVLKDGTQLDVCFHQEDSNQEPSCEIWDTALDNEDGKYYINHEIDCIDNCEILGNPINYFGEEPINVPWMNAFQLDKQFTNFKIR